MQSLSKPLIGFIVDYFNKLKTMLCVLIVSLVLLSFALFSLPSIPMNTSNSERSNSTLDYLDTCHACKRYKVSKLEPNFWIEKDKESSYYSTVEDTVSLKIISSIPCGNNQAFNFSDFSFLCYFNGSFFTLEEKNRIEDMSMHVISSKSLCSTYINEMNTSCEVHIPDCSLCCNDFSSCFPSVNDSSKINYSYAKPEKSVSSDFKSYNFFLFTIVYVLMYACIGSLFVLSDTACCGSVEKTGAEYGKQRMFGSLGWGLMSVICGIFSTYTQNYKSAGAVTAVMCVAMLWNMPKMDFEKPRVSKTFFKDVGSSFLSMEFVAFEIGALLNGIGLGAIRYYLVWFLVTIGGNDILVGLVPTVQNLLGEFPFMFIAGWMIRKMGYFYITTLSLFSYCIRFLFLSYLQNPWYALLMEWTDGISYGVYYVAIASYATISSKPGTEATMQSILFMTFDGLGTVTGNILVGIGIDYFGSHQTFYYAGIFFGCVTFFNVVVHSLLWIQKQ